MLQKVKTNPTPSEADKNEKSRLKDLLGVIPDISGTMKTIDRTVAAEKERQKQKMNPKDPCGCWQ